MTSDRQLGKLAAVIDCVPDCQGSTCVTASTKLAASALGGTTINAFAVGLAGQGTIRDCAGKRLNNRGSSVLMMK